MSTEAQVRARIRVRTALAELEQALEQALEASIEAAEGTPLDNPFEALGYSVTLLRAIARCLDGDPVTLHALRVLDDTTLEGRRA